MLIVEKLLIFLILMLVGLWMVKLKILDETGCRYLSSIVVNIAGPAMIINASITDSYISGSELLTTTLIALAMYALLIALAALMPKILRLKRGQEGTYAVMTVFSNIGFMGIPLVSAIYGDGALLYVTIFIIIFNVLIYTYGVIRIRQPQEGVAPERLTFNKLLNPGVIASAIAMAIYLLHIPIPEVLSAPVGYLGDLTAPLSMLVLGASLAYVKISSIFTDVRLLAFSAIKLLLVPVIVGLLLKLFISSELLLGVCIIMVSAPVASMTVMMAQQYGGDDTLFSKGVALTTLLCVATIPAVFAVLL